MSEPSPQLQPTLLDSQRQPLRFTRHLITLIAIAALAVALYALYHSSDLPANGTAQPDITGPLSPDNARMILDRADDASNQAGNILSFLEVLLAIAGFLGAGLLLIVRSTLEKTENDARELEKNARELMEFVKAELVERERMLGKLEQDLRNEVAKMHELMLKEVQEAHRLAESAFSVLRLQLLAEQQVRSHNIDSALKTLIQAHNQDPNDHATNYLLGYLYVTRDVNQAFTYLEKALELNPDFTPGIAALGLTLRKMGDKIKDESRAAERDELWREAETKLLTALGQDPALTDAEEQSYYGSLGGLYRRQGRYHAALDAYQNAHRVTPNATYPLINLASIHKYLGNDERAKTYFRQVIERAKLTLDDNPRDLWTRCDYAQALLLLGDRSEAANQIAELLEQEPQTYILDVVIGGLKFLEDAPTPIPHLPEIISTLEEARDDLVRQQTAQKAVQSNE